MNYWEDFFSLEKFWYPVVGSFLTGFLFLALISLASIDFNEIGFYVFLGVGFIVGNIIKIKKIKEYRAFLRAQKKKSKAIK